MLVSEQLQHFRRHRLILAQPEVDRLLQLPRNVTEIGQPHHPPTAFQRVRSAADRAQRFGIAGIGSQQIELFVERSQYFGGLFEEDTKQFGINFLMRRFSQLQGCRRRLLRFLHLRLEASQRGIGTFAGLQGFQRRLGILAQFNIGNEVSIFLDRLQILLELILQPDIFRRLMKRRHQGLCIASVLGKLRFNARRGNTFGFGRRFYCSVSSSFHRRWFFAFHPANKDLEISFPVLQGIDKKAEQGQLICHPLELFTGGQTARPSELLNTTAALLEAARRRKMAKHGQRAANLPDRAIQLRQIMGFSRIAEEAIQRLLDLSQIILNLTPDLANQEFFLSAPRHFIEQRNPGIIGRRFARYAGVQAGNHQVNLLGKIGSQALETLLSVL